MKSTFSASLSILVLLAAFAGNSDAVTVVECVDASGSTFFGDRCPPGARKKSEKKFQGDIKAAPVDVGAIAAQHPVVFYTAPDCPACDAVRVQLQTRGVPFAEKDAASDPAIQKELTALTGSTDGTLKVPVVHVDDNVVGYTNSQALHDALDQAGYPPPPGETHPATTPAAPSEQAPPAGGITEGERPPGPDPDPAGGDAAISSTGAEPAPDSGGY